LLQWLIEHKQSIENQGFIISKANYENKEIALLSYDIQMNIAQQNDWFDLHGQIKIGEWLYPFSKFVPYLKNDNSYFPLPDGSFFYIPEEWFSKYQGIAQFGKSEGNSLKIAKSQQSLLAKAELIQANENDLQAIDNEEVEVSEKIKATLRPYQLEGFRWMLKHYQNDLGACLADDMGLGKTLQTIAVLQYAKEQRSKQMSLEAKSLQLDIFSIQSDENFLNPLQALIILPSSLVFNWRAELLKFAPHLQVCEHIGNKRSQDIRILKRYDIVLTTYQTALKDKAIFENFDWEYIILDESHYIKNPDSQVFKAISAFEGRHKISLSGTPIENSLSDLWAQMQFINPGLLGSLNSFKTDFIKPIEKGGNQDKKQRLHDLVKPYLLRRTKGEVAKDLPDLIEQIIYVDMLPEQAKRYEQERSAARNLILNFDEKNFQQRQQVFNALLRLRQIANHPQLVADESESYKSGKQEEVMEYWDTLQKAGHKMLFFSSFTKHLDLYKEILTNDNQKYSYLTGQLTPKEREKNIARFREEPDNHTFLISLKAGGVGLNLTEASYVFMLDPWWNPQAENQAIARAHRIGQDKTVIALKFITRNSIEEKILKLQERKSQLAADILESAESLQLTKQELQELIN
jgi:non-specific serine/threonine protein kinase